MRPIVRLEQIAVRLGRTPILRQLDLELAPGDVVGISGANGSGKTTLLRTAATLLKPETGSAVVLGADATTDERYAVRTAIAFVGHTPSLYLQLTLAENTEFAGRFLGADAERAAEALDMVGLRGASARRASECSFGMQRRAEFARIMMAQPQLVLFDEAHVGLDRTAGELVEHVLKGVRARGGAALVVSHQEDRSAPLVDRMLLLEQGRLWNRD